MTPPWIHQVRRAIGQIIGAPDYDTYLHHMQKMHPQRPPLDRQRFLRERMEARYRGGNGRCC